MKQTDINVTLRKYMVPDTPFFFYRNEVRAAMEEHTSNELASYKAELRAKIEESVSAEKDVLQSPLNYHHKDVESARKIYNTAKSILVILEDNPTEK